MDHKTSRDGAGVRERPMPKLLNLLAFAVGASIAMSGLAIVTPAPAQADEADRQLEMPKRTHHQGWLP